MLFSDSGPVGFDPPFDGVLPPDPEPQDALLLSSNLLSLLPVPHVLHWPPGVCVLLEEGRIRNSQHFPK